MVTVVHAIVHSGGVTGAAVIIPEVRTKAIVVGTDLNAESWLTMHSCRLHTHPVPVLQRWW